MLTKNQVAEAEALMNGINSAPKANIKREKKGSGIVERENKVVLTEDNRQILLG